MKAAPDFFSISKDDPNAINFWQEDVFNTADLEKNNREKPRNRRN